MASIFFKRMAGSVRTARAIRTGRIFLKRTARAVQMARKFFERKARAVRTASQSVRTAIR